MLFMTGNMYFVSEILLPGILSYSLRNNTRLKQCYYIMHVHLFVEKFARVEKWCVGEGGGIINLSAYPVMEQILFEFMS